MSHETWQEQLRRGSLDLAILLTVSSGPRYGLAIIQHLEAFTDLVVTEGTIYPVLREFEEGAYVTVENSVVSGRPRKTYTLTNKGREAFKVGVEAWMEVTQALTETESVIARDAGGGCCG